MNNIAPDDWAARIAASLAPQFEPAMGSWYAAGEPDLEWRLKNVNGNSVTITARNPEDDSLLEVTISVSDAKRVTS